MKTCPHKWDKIRANKHGSFLILERHVIFRRKNVEKQPSNSHLVALAFDFCDKEMWLRRMKVSPSHWQMQAIMADMAENTEERLENEMPS